MKEGLINVILIESYQFILIHNSSSYFLLMLLLYVEDKSRLVSRSCEHIKTKINLIILNNIAKLDTYSDDFSFCKLMAIFN